MTITINQRLSLINDHYREVFNQTTLFVYTQQCGKQVAPKT